MEKMLLFLAWLLPLQLCQISTINLTHELKIGDFQYGHMISTSSSDTSQVIFTNLLTNSQLYNFTTNGTVQKILSHPDNTVEDLANIRYLVGDGELNYYAHNTHIYGPLTDVGAFCFLDSKYNFSWA